MRAILIRWLASGLTLLVVAQVVEGFHVDGVGAAMAAVVVLAIGNLLLQPFVKAISAAGCLINLVTLGLFEAVVHFAFWVLAFWLIGDVFGGPDGLVPGFGVDGFVTAAKGAGAVTVVNAVISPFLKNDDNRDRRHERERRA